MVETSEDLFPVARKLKEDVGGAERDSLVNSLEKEAAGIKRNMDAGIAPSEFADLDAVHKAFEAAVRVVDAVSRRHQAAA